MRSFRNFTWIMVKGSLFSVVTLVFPLNVFDCFGFGCVSCFDFFFVCSLLLIHTTHYDTINRLRKIRIFCVAIGDLSPLTVLTIKKNPKTIETYGK